MAETTSWEGDFEELASLRDRLTDEPAVCERVFASKSEAFLAGLYLAEHPADGASTASNGS